MTKVMKLKSIGVTIGLLIIYVFVWGYNKNSGDMIEIIPSLKKMIDPALYSKDFYLNYIDSLKIHERSIYLSFLKLIQAQHEWILFSFFIVCLFCFIYFLLQLTYFFINDELLSVVTVLIILFPLKYTSVGANELFYNMATSAVPAKTLAVASIYYFLKDKKVISYLLLIGSTLFHVLVGFQLFLIMVGVQVLQNFNERLDLKKYIPALIYVILILPYIYLLWSSRLDPHVHGNTLSDLLEFRIGHHFFIQYNSLATLLIYSILFILAIAYGIKHSRFIFYFSILQGIGMGIYVWQANFLKNEIILQSQWFKTTIWIELLSTISIMAFIKNFTLPRFQKLLPYFSLILILSILLASHWMTREDPSDILEEEKLAQWSQKNTPKDALFAYSPAFTRFKSISERSSWIDYKSISHQLGYLIPWYDRIDRIYKINLEDRRNGKDLVELATQNFNKINIHDLTYLFYSQGVDFIILPTQLSPSEFMYPAFSTTHYTIYKRRDLN